MEQNTTSVVIEQQGENKKRGVLAVILAVAFVAMLGIGSTFAYLTWSGNQTPNRFTIDSALTGDLLEPAWTNAEKTGKASDSIAIPEAADQTTKEVAIAKDPYVVNTSKKGLSNTAGENGYAMIRLTFQKWSVTSKTGSGVNYKEEGKYVNMSAKEITELLNVYSFTDKVATDEGKITDATAGLDVNANWQLVGKDGADIKGSPSEDQINASFTNSSLYFYYKGVIQSMGRDSSGKDIADKTTITEYPAAATALSKKDSMQSATTSLFKNVVQVKDASDDTATETPFGDFTGDIKGQSQNPGWRVLVDCSLAYASATSFAAPNSTAINALIAAVDDIEVNADGTNPQNSVSEPDTAYGYLDSDGKAIGSGLANGFTGLPETKWEKQVKQQIGSFGETTSGFKH